MARLRQFSRFVDSRPKSGWLPALDIYRSAQVLAKRHGKDAPIEAAMRADAMRNEGDVNRHAVWQRVLRAVGELRRVEPDARVH